MSRFCDTPFCACSAEAEAFADALQGDGVSGLVANHVLRQHVFPLFVFTVLFLALYVAYNIVGDPLLKLLKVCLIVGKTCLIWEQSVLLRYR